MTPAELEARIRVDVEAAKTEGFAIMDCIYFTNSGPPETPMCCCALGACARNELAAERRTKPLFCRREDSAVIREALSLSDCEFISFVEGFDGCAKKASTVVDFYDLGARMRRLYVDGAA